ncbi:anti-sigma factor family protein [Chamaesiphon polymorphus]|uniref:Anti-sigma factor n=1 Tax=Chamaesiphon polymorphus CCALA 037 TaxID=2107692 RepID=A0A2T1GIB5_9CYAN|nr:zf-HC2 domain-containing protein [Chamaesiphon polymorphus]PSB57369.1 anti-sigma factor [Chamaesiphon polymorphus CCALA 037]
MTDNFDGERSGAILDERFELLSAYLDGEVTATERQQVEAWLATDRAFQHQYRQLQQINQAMPRLTIPSSQSADALAAGVFGKLDRQRNRKFAWFGGGAIAATLLAALTGLGGLFGGNDRQFQFANNKANTPAPLMLALNDPILSIPAKGENAIELPMSSPEVNAD